MRKYIRTCQECLNQQEDTDPATLSNANLPDPWLNRKCKKCKSEALDYGSWRDNSDERTPD